jgi:hypothetical protein
LVSELPDFSWLQHTKTVKNKPSKDKFDVLNAIKYTKLPQNIPKINLPRPSKMYQNLDFEYRNMPSGNLCWFLSIKMIAQIQKLTLTVTIKYWKILENNTEGSFSKIATLKKTKFLFSFFQPTMQVSKKLLPVPVFSNKATNNASQQCQILHHSIVM